MTSGHGPPARVTRADDAVNRERATTGHTTGHASPVQERDPSARHRNDRDEFGGPVHWSPRSWAACISATPRACRRAARARTPSGQSSPTGHHTGTVSG